MRAERLLGRISRASSPTARCELGIRPRTCSAREFQGRPKPWPPKVCYPFYLWYRVRALIEMGGAIYLGLGT